MMADNAIPAEILRPLAETLARWDGRGATDAETLRAGRDMAAAVMDLLVWDATR